VPEGIDLLAVITSVASQLCDDATLRRD